MTGADRRHLLGLLVVLTAPVACALEGTFTPRTPQAGEKHLKSLRQLTDGGENAEAYFSGDGGQLIFQSTHGELKCDQIFVMSTDGSGKRRVSTGKGRTTCSYFFPGGARLLYASTHLAGDECPPPPPRGGGYVWPVYESYDIFTARPDGTDIVRLTATPGYDAEATVSSDGSRIVFTSVRDGDLDVHVMKADGSEPRRLTNGVGYDGGAFFSADGARICYRASRPQGPEAVEKYKKLLAGGLVEPSSLEIYVMNTDGTGTRQLTANGAANFCPFFHPSGKKVIFSSNKDDPARRNFELYMVSLEGGEPERLTFEPAFDGFPMFSPDGKKLVWCANRHNTQPRDTNVFIADWVD